MSRAFGGGTDAATNTVGAALNTYPRTYACRFRRTIVVGSIHSLIAQGTSGGSGTGQRDAVFVDASGNLSLLRHDGVALTTIVATPAITTNQWHTVIAECASASSASIWLDNAGVGTSAVNRTNSFNQVAIGVNVVTLSTLNNGHEVAEAAIWSAQLSAEERAAYNSGVSPLLIKPESLICYWQLIGRYSPEIDLKGFRSLTITGTTAVPHPSVRYARGNKLIPQTVAIPQTLTPGQQTILFTNPAATLSLGGQILAAGQQLINFTNPAIVLVADQTLLPGQQTIRFTNPAATLVTSGNGQVPRASKYRLGSVLHWVWRQ